MRSDVRSKAEMLQTTAQLNIETKADAGAVNETKQKAALQVGGAGAEAANYQ